MIKTSKKGFTLLELLIVIAILAILATAVVLVLNPAEYLRQARDTQRMTDMDTLRNAINLYLSSTTTPDLTVGVAGDAARCMVGITSPFTLVCSTNATTAVTGTGWVLVNFAGLSEGSPLSVLPKDPTNDTAHYYAYAADESANQYELNANLESTKYSANEGNDGGNNANWYEVGNKPGLDL